MPWLVWRLLTAGLVAFLLTVPAVGRTAKVQVSSSDGVYRVAMSFKVRAPVSQVRDIVTDYAHLSRVNPAITATKVLPPPKPGVVRVRIKIKDCVMFFCPKIVRVEDIMPAGQYGLKSKVVPSLSNIAYGTTHWSFEPRGTDTEVRYHSTMKPDFWIPPLIGPALIRKQLRKQLQTTSQNLRRLAAKDGNSNRWLDSPRAVQ